MSQGSSDVTVVFYGSYGTNVIDHLAADGTGLAGGQVAVVTIGQVNAHFLGSLASATK